MGYSGGYGNPSDGGYNKPDYSYGGSYNKNTGYVCVKFLWGQKNK